MNFLAHLYLSGNSDKIKIGNFIGDAVKGKQYMHYEADIIKGIELHRAIDTFTDQHPIVEESKQRLRQKYRKYAGVIVDMFYDHYLAALWHQYSATQLDDFINDAYAMLQKNFDVLPQKSQYMLPHMIRHNWLKSYAHVEGIHQALTGMSQRTSFDSGMEHASQALREDYQLYQQEFERFFPELVTFANDKLQHA